MDDLLGTHNLAEARRYRRRSRDVLPDPVCGFYPVIQDLDLAASPGRAAKSGDGPRTDHAEHMKTWLDRAELGDARAMCCIGLYLALTGQREQARAWLGRTEDQMAEGPGLIPPSFGLLDADAQLGMLSGLLDPLVDGLRMGG